MIRCWFVHDHRADFPINKLRELVDIPRATYYRFANPNLSERFLDDAYLANEIFDIWQRSRRTYGSPRVWGQLRRSGRRVGLNRVARLMRECGLVGAHARKRWRRGRPNTAPAPDLVERDFTAAASNLKWVADVTEFACVDGKLYLAGIVDLHDRGICGWSMGERNNTDLVVNALVMALSRRHPDGELVHHADRGSNYTSLEFTNRLTDWNIAPSYGSTGDCFDNAAMEATWATLKREIRHIHGDWREPTRSELRTILFDYIEIFYNRQLTNTDSATKHQPRPTLHQQPETATTRVSQTGGTPQGATRRGWMGRRPEIGRKMEFEELDVPPVSYERLDAFAAMCEVAFPDSFRRFLTRFQGAKPIAGSFDIPSTGRNKYIEQFCVKVQDIADSKFGWADIGVVYAQADERLTTEDGEGNLKVAVPFAVLFAGDLLVLDTRQSRSEPRVAVWFHERSEPYAPYLEDVAESFDAFLELVGIDLDEEVGSMNPSHREEE